MMSVFNRIKMRANNQHANNFGTILESYYGDTQAKVIEQIVEGQPVKAYIVREKVLEVATYTPLKRNERFGSPLNLHIETYPLKNIVKVSEEYEEHALEKNNHLAIKTKILFNDGESVEIDDSFGLYNGSLYHEFKEDYIGFLKSLKEVL
jgi:hypothetical protein